MRRLVPAFLLVLVCSPAMADSVVEAALPPPVPAMVPVPVQLPSPCDECVRGRAAWIMGVYKTPSQAKVTAKGRGIAPGYPIIAHTSEIGIKGRRGSVVILGLFKDLHTAKRWKTQHRYGEVVELGHWTDAEPETDSMEITRIVRIDDKPAPVYAEADIDFETPRSKLTPLCELPAHSVYLLRPREHQMFAQWVPARCPSGKKGYVFKIDTLLDTAFVPKKDGSVKLMQNTHVVCDMSSVDEWDWVDGKRVPVEGWAYDTEGNASGGCGAY